MATGDSTTKPSTPQIALTIPIAMPFSKSTAMLFRQKQLLIQRENSEVNDTMPHKISSNDTLKNRSMSRVLTFLQVPVLWATFPN